MSILILFVLTVIVYQDFKFRAISWFLPPLIFFLLFYLVYQQPETLKYILINTVFIIFNLLLVTFYFSVRNKKPIFLFKDHLGMGDFLFFIAITPIFHPVNYVLFFVVSLLITLIASLTCNLIIEKQRSTVPLAGWMSIQMIVLLVIQTFNTKGLLALQSSLYFL